MSYPKKEIITDTTKIPIRWCTPEYLKEMKCSVASDVWRFGVLMWEMANPGKISYDNFSNSEVLQKIRAGYTLTIPSLYPKEVQNILSELCWNHDGNSSLYSCTSTESIFPNIEKHRLHILYKHYIMFRYNASSSAKFDPYCTVEPLTLLLAARLVTEVCNVQLHADGVTSLIH